MLPLHNLPSHKTVTIENNQTGITFSKLFDQYLTQTSRVTLTDPYLNKQHQLRNLHAFCICLYKFNISYLIIETLPETASDPDFQDFIKTFQNSTNQALKITAISTSSIHDREIILYDDHKLTGLHQKSGTVVRLGRGLDIFQPVEKYSLAWNGYDEFRKCRECKIDFFRKNFDVEEDRKEREIINQIKKIKEEAENYSMKNPAHKSHFNTQQLEKIDCLEIKSDYGLREAGSG